MRRIDLLDLLRRLQRRCPSRRPTCSASAWSRCSSSRRHCRRSGRSRDPACRCRHRNATFSDLAGCRPHGVADRQPCCEDARTGTGPELQETPAVRSSNTAVTSVPSWLRWPPGRMPGRAAAVLVLPRVGDTALLELRPRGSISLPMHRRRDRLRHFAKSKQVPGDLLVPCLPHARGSRLPRPSTAPVCGNATESRS